MQTHTRILFAIRHKETGLFLKKVTDNWKVDWGDFEKARLFTKEAHTRPKMKELGDRCEIVTIKVFLMEELNNKAVPPPPRETALTISPYKIYGGI